jgi:plastocyanin
MNRTATFLLGAAIALVLVAVACGGGDSSSSTPSSPTATPTPTPTPTPSTGTTITITSSGVSPQSVTVAVGSRVTFVNNDTRVHDMNSDPHPQHTTCPELNQVGFLAAGETKQTGNLVTARTCTYHDHNQSTNTSLQGTIIIQ